MDSNEITIAGQNIGKNHSVFIIAEAGINHNGKINLALKLIDKAAESGADAIKFQTFKAEQVVIKIGRKAHYQKNNTNKDESQQQMLKKIELSEKSYPQIINRCLQKGVIFLSTPHGGFNSVDLLEKHNIIAYKIGSGDLNNLPLLSYIASKCKPIIISTGMGTFAEINEAVKIIENTSYSQIALLHCTSNYPCPKNQVNLNSMIKMIEKYHYPIGYSDHTKGTEIPIYACLLGATIIEKHLTLNRNFPGPDQKNSLEPNEFKLMVQKIRELKKYSKQERKSLISKIPNEVLGSTIKTPNHSEISISKVVRKSLVWNKYLPKDHIINKTDIEIKRPGTGIQPKQYWSLIGKKTTKIVKKDNLIKKLEFI